MRPTEYVVLWCDSPLGLISLRVQDDGTPVTFTELQIPPDIQICERAKEVFKVLNEKDGTKIAVPFNSLFAFFGWEV